MEGFCILALCLLGFEGSNRAVEIKPRVGDSVCLQQSLKGYNDSPDVIIEAQFDDSDSEDGHGNTQNALVDGVKKLSVCVQEKGEYRTAF